MTTAARRLIAGTTSRPVYFLSGVGLFAVKFGIDTAIASLFGRTWSPLNYLVWPDPDSARLLDLPADDQVFGFLLLAVALPFILTGVTFTVRRLRDAGLPVALTLLFFVPLVNLTFLLALCLVPTRLPAAMPVEGTALARRVHAAHGRVTGGRDWLAAGLACVASVAVTVAGVALSANLLKSYGFGVFVLAPVTQGWLAALLYAIPRRRTMGDCVAVAAFALALSGAALLAVAIEGAICICMAAPLGLPLAALGGVVGYAVQLRGGDAPPLVMLALLVSLPALIAAETHLEREPGVRAVVTTVDIAAPPAEVWKHVVEFPPLPEPTDLLFRTGLAYPLRAEIRGRGVGAVRHCVFSTGPFVEPITTWDEPRCLAFDVTDQPPPMEELSPFHVHPPHLDNFLVSRRGRFRLTETPTGTRLEGTTWYTNRMWPAAYWHRWSDLIIGRIHRQVLDHVRTQAETPRLP